MIAKLSQNPVNKLRVINNFKMHESIEDVEAVKADHKKFILKK
jgi:hypothetical protein